MWRKKSLKPPKPLPPFEGTVHSGLRAELRTRRLPVRRVGALLHGAARQMHDGLLCSPHCGGACTALGLGVCAWAIPIPVPGGAPDEPAPAAPPAAAAPPAPVAAPPAAAAPAADAAAPAADGAPPTVAPPPTPRAPAADGATGAPAAAPAAAESDSEEIICTHCGSGADDRKMLLCDGTVNGAPCPHAYHTYCLDPPLASAPRGDWFCPSCERAAEEGAPVRGLVAAVAVPREDRKLRIIIAPAAAPPPLPPPPPPPARAASPQLGASSDEPAPTDAAAADRRRHRRRHRRRRRLRRRPSARVLARAEPEA